jgi:imidazolonepropionase-like amidohydrolase
VWVHPVRRWGEGALRTAVVGGRLFDGTGDELVDGLTVTFEDDCFVSISADPPRTSEVDSVVDLGGRALLPGLINAHTHFAGVSLGDDMAPGEVAAWTFEHLRRALDLGFTTCRETGGLDGGVVSALDKGLVTGPRMRVAGPLLVQTGGHGEFRPPYVADPCAHHQAVPGLYQLSVPCDGPDAVRAAARMAFKRGAHFLKMCATGGVTSMSDSLEDTQLTVEEMRAAVEESQARRTYVTVHTHNKAGILRGLEAGVACFEHGTGLDEESALAVKTAGAAIVPTLTVAHVYGTYGGFLPSEIIARAAGVEEGMRRAVALGHEHGLLVGCGADLIGPDQKQYGMEVGLVAEVVGAAQALRTATADNAKVLRMADQVGTVEAGKLADLVAVDGDPLADPTLLADPANISWVVQGGKVAKSQL